ncbi:LysR family transcriptional regulator [Anaeromyxobacter paludicola]|uniref:LysR family transcriptional regulator n=1 Tax=Anaeromyxobacter paludicola TaxID=2918171 RepID=A0ABN6N685_9BACT|nr:LysR family transcriptional regulator [Anaeromyxobacter paludicola]BDG08556.1 LysR family transcriptional regulator [Anaeromyxobacter paludicola]
MRSYGRKTDQPLPVAWDDLRTALFLARAGSVRGAARALGVSHSTVLRRLAGLEAAAGVRLFDRTASGYELTPAGQDVFDTAGQVEDVVLSLERRVQGRDLRLSGPVRVTMPDPFLPLLLPALRELGQAYPDIALTVSGTVGFADLAHREADVALRVAAEPPPDLVGRRVAVAGAAVYGAERYLAGRSTKDLAALDWIAWDATPPMALDAWRRANVPDARVALSVTTVAGLRDAVDAGLGVAAFPCALGGAMAGWRCLRLLHEAATPLWVLTHQDLRTTARVRVVRDFLAGAIAARRALIEGRAPPPRAPQP